MSFYLNPILRLDVVLLRLWADGLLNFPVGRDDYGHTDGAVFPPTQERAQTLQLSAIPGNVALHLCSLFLSLVAKVAEFFLELVHLVAKLHITLFIVVAIFAQFSDEPVIVFNLLLLIVENLLIGVLHLLRHIDFGRLGFSLFFFYLYFGLFCLGLCFRPLPTPSTDTTQGTATEEQAEDSDD